MTLSIILLKLIYWGQASGVIWYVLLNQKYKVTFYILSTIALYLIWYKV